MPAGSAKQMLAAFNRHKPYTATVLAQESSACYTDALRLAKHGGDFALEAP